MEANQPQDVSWLSRFRGTVSVVHFPWPSGRLSLGQELLICLGLTLDSKLFCWFVIWTLFIRFFNAYVYTMHICVCVEANRKLWISSLERFIYSLWERLLHWFWSSPIRLDWLARELQRSVDSTGVTSIHHYTWHFHMGSGHRTLVLLLGRQLRHPLQLSLDI